MTIKEKKTKNEIAFELYASLEHKWLKHKVQVHYKLQYVQSIMGNASCDIQSHLTIR